MNTSFLFAASVAAGITAVTHATIGSNKNAAPVFRAKDVPYESLVTVKFAWHAASVFLLFVTAIYLWAAFTGEDRSLVLVTTLHCAVLAALSATMAFQGGIRLRAFPPFPLFTLIAVFGALALATQGG